jgi:DNA-binding beta-propeller fold protein YncE
VGIAISPDGNTAYVAGYGLLGGNYFNVLSIDLYTGNPIAALGTGPNFGTDIAITPDGKTAYVTNGLNLFLSIPENVSVIDVTYNTIIKTITDPEVLPGPWSVAITPDGTSVYVSDIESFYTSSPIGSVVVLSTPKYSASILPPSSISGCKTRNVFLFQTDYINNITWTAPTVGTPVSYNIYRDAALTQLAANVPASGTLQYYDHGRQPNVVYSYYITSVDANGNESIATSVTVTQNC